MHIKQGIQVSAGVAIAQAVVVDAEDVRIPRHTISASKIPSEHGRLEAAIHQSLADIDQLREQASATLGPELAKIFDFHAGMLRDPHLTGQIQKLIESEKVTAEYAVYVVLRRQAMMIRNLDNRYFRQRVKDVWDIERRILGHLIGHTRAELGHLQHDAVVIAHDLTPSQTASLDKSKIKALATDAGGSTSHTAILAHALGIPAVVGLEDVTGAVNTGDTVIIDGNRGTVIVRPDAAQLMTYRKTVRRIADHETTLDGFGQLPAVTKDGTEINIQANIEFPSEISAALEKGATGIGLYRTEFLYLASDSEPSEDQQYEAYMEAVVKLAGRPLTIRTLDLGADKLASDDADLDHIERNPFLGCRSIRLCLQNLPLFKTQLRAILRASTSGPIRVMFPLISNMMELRQAKMIMNDVMEDLHDEGIAYADDLPIGIMVEVPSTAIQIKIYADEVDFLSVGTNDLIQYTLAVDRGNERVASLYSAAHPSVIQLIKDVLRTANRTQTDISLCGEMAGEPEYVMLLLGLGYRSLSMTPPAIPEVKKIIRSVSLTQCRRVARRASNFESDREVFNYLRSEARKVVPEVFEGLSVD